MKFKVNDKVRLIARPTIEGVITKRFMAENTCDCIYMFNDGAREVLVREDIIELVRDVSYTYEFEFLDNVVVAKFFELTDTAKTEICRGHGHIIHEGVKGIAQASSYAMKKIYEKMNFGGEKK